MHFLTVLNSKRYYFFNYLSMNNIYDLKDYDVFIKPYKKIIAYFDGDCFLNVDIDRYVIDNEKSIFITCTDYYNKEISYIIIIDLFSIKITKFINEDTKKYQFEITKNDYYLILDLLFKE